MANYEQRTGITGYSLSSEKICKSHSFSLILEAKKSLFSRLHSTMKSKRRSDKPLECEKDDIEGISEDPHNLTQTTSLNKDSEKFIESHSAPGSFIFHSSHPKQSIATTHKIPVRCLSESATCSIDDPNKGRILLKQDKIRTHRPHAAAGRRVRIKKKYLSSSHRPRKIVVVGDMHCGKTCLVSSYCTDRFIDTYSPTILKCMPADCRLQGKQIDLIVADTPGRYDYLPLRKIAYDKCDLVIICFALDSPPTLENVEKFWVPEVKSNAPGIPFIIVGNRRDHRDEEYAKWCGCEVCQQCHTGCQKDSDTLKKMDTDKILESMVLSFNQGSMVATKSGAVAYQECSAKFRDNTRAVFECATKMALQKHRRKRKHSTGDPPVDAACIIL